MADGRIAFGKAIFGFDDRRHSTPISVTPVSGPFSAYLYQCVLNVDWDGAHNAYGMIRPDEPGQTFPQQKDVTPLESGRRGSLSNARRGGTGDWVGLVVKNKKDALDILRSHYPGWASLGDPKKPAVLSKAQESIFKQFLDTRTNVRGFGTLEDMPGNGKFPIVQLSELHQPYPGYYVSQCPAYDRSGPIHLWDQNIYLNAAEVAYSVVPKLPNVRKGDYGLIIRNKSGDSTPFLFADTGSKEGSTTLGECSGYIYEEVADGQYEDQTFSFIVFPGSGSGVADKNAVENMDKTVRRRLGNIARGDDALATRLSGGSYVEYMNITSALVEHGAFGLYNVTGCVPTTSRPEVL